MNWKLTETQTEEDQKEIHILYMQREPKSLCNFHASHNCFIAGQPEWFYWLRLGRKTIVWDCLQQFNKVSLNWTIFCVQYMARLKA